jgi:hypothetical protein
MFILLLLTYLGKNLIKMHDIFWSGGPQCQESEKMRSKESRKVVRGPASPKTFRNTAIMFITNVTCGAGVAKAV